MPMTEAEFGPAFDLLTLIQRFPSRRKSRFLLLKQARFSLQTKVADGSLDAPNANKMASL